MGLYHFRRQRSIRSPVLSPLLQQVTGVLQKSYYSKNSLEKVDTTAKNSLEKVDTTVKNSLEKIDFVIRWRGQCTLIEVKAETGNAKSAKTILNHPEKYHVDQCIKLGNYNVGRSGKILTLPFYMGFLLTES